MNSKLIFAVTLLVFSLAFVACEKSGSDSDDPAELNPPGTPNSALRLSYTDSIFYIQNSGSNIIIPKPMNKPGKFIGFPEGIEIDENSGAINLKESETGLRYKIIFVPSGSTDTVSTKIVISGINFYDGIYRLSQGDTIVRPIYNAKGQAYLPGMYGTGTNNSFDDDRGCNNQGCAVSFINGSINLAQSLRSGAISSSHDSQKEFTYYYRMDDASQRSLNKLKVKLYYYNSYADIPQYLWDILLVDHAGTILRGEKIEIAKPRPPCIILIGN